MSLFKRPPPLLPGTQLVNLLMVAMLSFTPVSKAETISIPLSQEQNGGDAGRACIYVWHGSAQYRVVKADELCAPEITIESETGNADGNI